MMKTTRSRVSAVAASCALLGLLILAGWKASSPATWQNPALFYLTDGAPLLIEARGVDRKWRFTYYGVDGLLNTDDDFTRTGELKLPVGIDVILELRSEDYIYVFSCPSLGLKEIAVPDLEYSLAFQPQRTGDHELIMDPMCGFQLPENESMGRVSVSSVRDFQGWIREMTRSR